jgi:hypothetical protein
MEGTSARVARRRGVVGCLPLVIALMSEAQTYGPKTLLNTLLRIPRTLLFSHVNDLADVIGVMSSDVGDF